MTSATVAIIPWGEVIEDFLEPLHLSLDDFLENMTGGWLFGTFDALSAAGIRPVLVCVTKVANEPQQRIHRGTGVSTWLIPAPRRQRWVRRYVTTRRTWEAPVVREGRRLGRLADAALFPVMPYLFTPLFDIARVLRTERCGAVLCQEYEDGRFDLLVMLGRLLSIPVFATFQGGNGRGGRLERRIRRYTVRASAGLLIGSSTERQRVHRAYGVAPERLHNVPNPVAVPARPDRRSRHLARQRLGLDDGASVVLWVGRISIHRKGLDTLVAAWSRCRAARPGGRLHLLMVGTGPDSDELRALFDSAGSEGVSWRDEYVNDRDLIATYHAAADVFAFPSRWEGFAVAPMEAMAAGLPVVAADAPGVAELIDDESVGRIVPLGNSEALAVALLELIDDPALAATIGVQRSSQCGSSLRLGSGRSPARRIPWLAFLNAYDAGERVHMSTPPLTTSVVIPTVGRRKLLADCVSSVLACDPRPGEVIVVDQGGGAAAEILSEVASDPTVRIVADEGIGIARATNVGITATSAPIVFVTHDDCTVATDWIGVGIELHLKFGGITTGRVLPPDGSSYVPSTIDEPEPRDFTGTLAAGRLYPANMVVGRAEFLEFGGFDERAGLRSAAEDNDLCYRWLASNRSLRYQPELLVWHHDWRSPEQLIATHIVYAHGQGAFYAKHMLSRDWRILRLLRWDLGHGLAARVRAPLTGTPRWTEPYYEMNTSLIAGIWRALPEAWRLQRAAGNGRDRT